jgi:hypothetical protein
MHAYITVVWVIRGVTGFLQINSRIVPQVTTVSLHTPSKSSFVNHLPRDLTKAQAVSHRLPTVATRVRSHRSCGTCGEKSGTGAGFLRILRFPLQILIPPTAPHSTIIIWGWYNRPIVTAVPNGLSLTLLRIIIKRLRFVPTVEG